MKPFEQYQQQMLTTMTQGDLLLKLFDETIRQIDRARAAIKNDDITEMENSIGKSLRIIRHLRGSLDRRYPVSLNLSQLYDFFDRQLVMANIKKDTALLDEVEPLILELRGTFAECDRIERRTRTLSMASGVG